MLDIAHLFIGTAFAQETAAPDPAAAAPASSMMSLANFVPLILIFAVFYFLILRPQNKKLAEQDKMIKSLQRGDRVITSGGIHGKISKLEDDTLMLEVADNVHIKVLRAQVNALAAKTNTATIANDGGEEKKN